MPYVAVGSGTTTGTVYQNNNRFKPLQKTAAFIILQSIQPNEKGIGFMESKRVAKVKKNGSTLRLTTCNPTSDDTRAVARELTASFMADTPPEKRSQQALDKWCAEFEEGSWRSVKHLTPKRRQRTHRRFGG